MMNKQKNSIDKSNSLDKTGESLRNLTGGSVAASLEFIKKLIDSMQDGLSVVDKNGLQINVNHALCQMTGFSRQELLGSHPPFPFWPPEECEHIQTAFQNTLNGKTDNYDLTFMRKSGERFPVIVSPSPVEDSNGGIICYLATVKDITGRKRGEDALRASEERYRSLVGASPMCIHEIDMEGRISSMNRAGLDMMCARDEREVRGLSYLDAVCAADRERIGELLVKAYAGETSHFEFTASGPAGLVFRSCFVPIRNQSGAVEKLMGITEDITESKRAQEELARKTAQLAERVKELDCLYGISKIIATPDKSIHETLDAVIHFIPQGWLYPEIACARIVFGEMEFKTANFRETSWTLSANILISNEFAGKLEIYYLEDKPAVYEGPFLKEERALIDELAMKLGVMIVQKLAEEDLRDRYRDREISYRQLTEQASEGIFVANKKGQYLEVNPAGLEMVGYSLAELREMTINDLVAPEDMEKTPSRFHEILSGKTVTSERVIRRKDGSLFHAEITAKLMTNGNVLATKRDITKRKQVEESLLAAKNLAEQANKAKSTFLASMSHEIRTPLNSVLGFSQILASDAEHPLSDFQRKMLGKVLKSGNQLLELINSVLDLAKIESGEFVVSTDPIEMKSLARTTITGLDDMARESGVRLRFETDVDDCYVMADIVLLHKALTNLISNAIKYNKKGGNAILSWRPLDENKVRISVIDEGPGISEDNIKNLFTPFDRMGMEGRNIKGFGIGLTIVKRLVESMRGEVGVESATNEGSTFYIDLPAANKPG